MIVATQRPSVDVITGTIKSNFPTRISYKVVNKINDVVFVFIYFSNPFENKYRELVKDLKIIKYIKFLLKEKGLTIAGVKKILNNMGSHSLDDSIDLSVYKPALKTTDVIKKKIKNISKIINELKNLKNG